MSLINAMLQDLDRRQALGTDTAADAVRASSASKPRREWFWYTLAVLMAMSVAWVGWVAFQIMPRTLATKLALSAGEQARPHANAVVEVAAAPVAQPVAERVAAEPDPVEPASMASAAARFETLRLAMELQTPVREPAQPKARASQAVATVVEPVKPLPAKPPANGTVDKRERTRLRSDVAEAHFRQAAVLLNQARVSEAEGQLVAALQADAGHVPARQAYVALLLEQQRIELARRHLQEALAINPKQPTFALALARIHVEGRDYPAALEVMEKHAPAKKSADFDVLRGVVLQRQGRDAEAVEAYQNALQRGPQPGTTWLGFAISLDALGRKPEAVQAYRKAIAAGQLTAEAREYAENRARVLE